MAELTALQSVPLGQIGSGSAQVFNPMPAVQILQQQQQRQDQIDWHNKQAALAKQKAEAEARKKAEEDEVVAKYKENQGEIFAKYGKEVRDSLINTGQQNWAGLKKPEKQQFIADVDDITTGVNTWSLGQDQKLKDWRLRNNSYYNVPSSVVEQEADDFARSKPDFYKRDFVSELDQKVRKNPAFYNFGAVGDDLVKGYDAVSVKKTDTRGIEFEDKFSPFFAKTKDPKTGKFKFKIDPSTGKPFFDKEFTMEMINKNPIAREMMENYVPSRTVELQKNPQFSNIKPDELGKVAQGELIDKFFKGRGVYNVAEDLEPTPERAGSKTKLPYTKSKGSRSSFTINMYDAAGTPFTEKDSAGNEIFSKQDGTWTDPNAENYKFDKPQVANANIRAFVMSNTEEAKSAGLVVKNNKGGYTLKQGFKYQLASKQRRPVAKEDIKFFKPDGQVEYIIKEGTPIGDETYKAMKNDPNKYKLNKVRMENGYEVTANVSYPNYDDEGEPIYSSGKQIKGGAFPTIKLFIPEDEAADIKTAIRQKESEETDNTPKAGSKW
jgi:hypothetical protein